MFEPVSVAAIAGTFLVAGTVKGVIGLGLPTVSLGLLTVVFDLTTAMALLVIPSLVTNVWQAVVGGHGRALLARTWPFLASATLTVWLGATVLTRVDLSLLSALLGALLVLYAGTSLAGFRPAIRARSELPAGVLFGAANGVLTGMTGSFVVPGVMFLQALGLARDMLVQAMGMLFTVSTLALAMALHGNGLWSTDLAVFSTAAVAPAILGMVAGRRVRRAISEEGFRRVFFVALLLLGAYIVARSL